MPPRISVVTPTLRRPGEVEQMLLNLTRQTVLPYEVILVDGAPGEERATEEKVARLTPSLPYPVRYFRHGGGTAIQRNAGIDQASGDYVAFIDDDIRLEPDYFERILEVYAADTGRAVGGIAGYIANQYLNAAESRRWRWYRRLRLFSTYEPGRYDYVVGYLINRYMQPPHEDVKEIDFMGSNCGVWRREVLDSGLRFDEFFRNYGVVEDAHFALRARQRWKLLECGRARCVHLHAPSGRENTRLIAWKTAVNYRYVFLTIVPQRTALQELRFWTVQAVQLIIYLSAALRAWDAASWRGVVGKFTGIHAAWKLKAPAAPTPAKP